MRQINVGKCLKEIGRNKGFSGEGIAARVFGVYFDVSVVTFAYAQPLNTEIASPNIHQKKQSFYFLNLNLYF